MPASKRLLAGAGAVVLALAIGLLPASLGAGISVSLAVAVAAGLVSFAALVWLEPRLGTRVFPRSPTTRRARTATTVILGLAGVWLVLAGSWMFLLMVTSHLLECHTRGRVERSWERAVRDWRIASPVRWGLLWGAAALLVGWMGYEPSVLQSWLLFLFAVAFGGVRAHEARTERRQLAATGVHGVVTTG